MNRWTIAVLAFLVFAAAGQAKAQEEGAAFRQGEALKAEGKYKEAADAFRKALDEGPARARRGATLALADTLVRSGERQEAVKILEAHLSTAPDDAGARLLLARTLSWMGEYDRSIGEYKKVLEARPADTEAKAGLARVYSWKGDLEESERLFREALKASPDDKDTKMGLARTLWWKGDIDASLSEARQVLSARPDDAEALELERRLREDRGPRISARYASSQDSDSNDIDSYRLSGFLNRGPLWRLGLDYTRLDVSSPGAEATADILDLKDSMRLFSNLTATPRLSLVSTDASANGTTYLTAGLSVNWLFAKNTRAIAAFSNYALFDTVRLMENDIRVNELSVAMARDAGRASYALSAAFANYSDGNSRYDVGANLNWRISAAPIMTIGVASDYREFFDSTTSGYFNPPNILTNTVFFEISDRIYQTALSYRAKARAGIQNQQDTSDYISSVEGALEWRIKKDITAEALYKYSKSAIESASGFRFEEFRLGLNCLF